MCILIPLSVLFARCAAIASIACFFPVRVRLINPSFGFSGCEIRCFPSLLSTAAGNKGTNLSFPQQYDLNFGAWTTARQDVHPTEEQTMDKFVFLLNVLQSCMYNAPLIVVWGSFW